MPGGTTYGIGWRLPFYSILTVHTTRVELSSTGFTMAGSAMMLAGLLSESYARQSLRTSCRVAKRSTEVSTKWVIYILIKRMDLKSCIPPTAILLGSLMGIRNWYQVKVWVVPFASFSVEVTLSFK